MKFLSRQSDLDALFGPVGEASRVKERSGLTVAYRQWIEKSSFAVLATSGEGGLDASPRGDPAPLVRVVDDRTLLLPERRGNNRIDSLRNLIEDPRVALIFFVPGVGETLRVNGKARICVDPELLASFAVAGASPKCVLHVSIESTYFQCARAIARSQLWAGAGLAYPSGCPTPGQMLDEISDGAINSQRYDEDLPRRMAQTLY